MPLWLYIPVNVVALPAEGLLGLFAVWLFGGLIIHAVLMVGEWLDVEGADPLQADDLMGRFFHVPISAIQRIEPPVLRYFIIWLCLSLLGLAVLVALPLIP